MIRVRVDSPRKRSVRAIRKNDIFLQVKNYTKIMTKIIGTIQNGLNVNRKSYGLF